MYKVDFEQWTNLESGKNQPGTRTALLIIHGIGEQMPFETLDQFARGMLQNLNASALENQTDKY